MAEQFAITHEILAEMLEKKQYTALRNTLCSLYPADIAGTFAHLQAEQLPLLFRLLPKVLAAETFVEMETEQQELLIQGFSDKELKEMLRQLYADDAAALVEEMPANVVRRILQQADPGMRRSINQILQYPDNSAGAMMTTEYVSLNPEMTVGESILRIRREGVNKETIYTCYVTDDKTLVGVVTVKDLLLAKNDNTSISNIMLTRPIAVTTHTDQEEVAHMFSKYDLLALPVVDTENRMVGIVTFDDAMDVLEDEITEDMELMGGILPSEKTYLRSSIWELFKNRIPWLMLLMLSATFTGLIITSFEEALAAQVALTAFIPMLMGTGGNSGSQSSVTIIRALSLDELRFSDLPRVLWKELRTSILCGVVLAIFCFGKIWLVDRTLLGNDQITLMVDAVVCLALLVTVIAAKIIGAVLPMAAKVLHADPAVMASPFITTIVDALSLLVYFLFAKMLLHL